MMNCQTEEYVQPSTKRPALASASLFLLLVAAYLANGNWLRANDTRANLYLSLSVLREGNLSFTPEEFPSTFLWERHGPEGTAPVLFNAWTPEARAAYDSGALQAYAPRYYVVPARRSGVYVNYFGFGAALAALPVIAPVYWCVRDLAADPVSLWFAGKLAAAMLVAGSAVFMFLSGCALVRPRHAWLAALAYGLGTCAWSTCSQGLWQQTANVFFLALGACFLVRAERSRECAAACGAALACAVWCRPTSLLVAACVGLYFLLRQRKALPAYILAGLPFAVALAACNTYYLGAPWRFGQIEGARLIAETKTGLPSLWQTPLFEGLAGLLVSPSRGLFVFSPFLVFAIWGAVRVWRNPVYAPLRPVCIAALLMLFVEAKHFDWWGGWSFGYRHLVDVSVLLALMLFPAMETIVRRKWLLAAFLPLLLWSIAAQILGVTAYTAEGWNNRKVTLVGVSTNGQQIALMDKTDIAKALSVPGVRVTGETGLDVDLPENRDRLWSIRDSELVYLVTHFSEARQTRRREFQAWRTNPAL